jgi:hypothetical protein
MYPDNNTSKFKVMLKDPIDNGDENWEVCLQSINYPYSWTNVGPAAKVYMKYYTGYTKGVQEIQFPDWQCESMTEVVGFIDKHIKSIEGSSSIVAVRELFVSLDELGRFKLKCEVGNVDIGFSPNMMRLLGMAGHPLTDVLTIEKFEERQKHREFLDAIMISGVQFGYNDLRKMREIKKCESLKELLSVVGVYLDWGKIANMFLDNPEMALFETVHEWRWAFYHTEYEYLLNKKYIVLQKSILTVEDMMHHFKSFANLQLPPVKLKGLTPGTINTVQRMYVYTNIIEPIDMNDKSVKLLKLVNTKGERFKTTQEDFLNPIYMKVKKGKMSMIEVLIADDSGGGVPFQSGTVVLTLHFRRVRRR